MHKLRLGKAGLLKLLFIFIICANTLQVAAQNEFELNLKKKMDSLALESGPSVSKQVFMPNNGVQSIMTPSGWGGSGAFIFGVIGGVYPALYTKKADMIGSIGLSIGDSKKHVNVSAGANIGRLSEFQDYSYNLIISRQVSKGSSISIGGLQLLSDPAISDSPDGSYYIAFSHATQKFKEKTLGYSPLTYTIGVGNGRFLLKSPWDVAAGKGKYGTAVFAYVSYEVFRGININAEWSGVNLGISTGFRPFQSDFAVGLGIYNLTKYSGDKASMLVSVGYPLSLRKKPSNIL